MAWRNRTTLYTDRGQWLQARRLTLGASEAAALLGESPFAGPWDVFAAKRNGTEVLEAEESDGSEGVDLNDPKVRGQVLEPMVGIAYTALTGRAHRRIGPALFGIDTDVAITRHPSEPWLTASLDAVVQDPELGEGVGEWKTAKFSWRWGPNGAVVDGTWDGFAGVLPQHIGVQALVQLAVTELPFCDVAVFTGGLCFRQFRVLRHEPTLETLVDVLRGLYQRHIIDGEEPDIDGSAACIQHSRELLAENRTKSRPATEEEIEWILLLVARKQAAASADVARAHILRAMGEHQKLTMGRSPTGEPRGVRVSVNGAVTAYGF